MSQTSLAVFSSPEFPWAVERKIAQLDRLVIRVLAKTELGSCAYKPSDSRWDFPCRARATVHHLANNQELCLEHFQAVQHE
jgi:hypothetical protein